MEPSVQGKVASIFEIVRPTRHGHGYKLFVLQRKMHSANQTFPIYSATVGIAATCTVPIWFITVTGHGHGVFILAMSSKGK
jgi:hypothetical protein